MTEKDFYTRYLRRALHKPPSTVLFRVEDYGIPDVILVREGNTYYLELKVLEHLPVREGTPVRVKTTVEQRRTMQQINRSHWNPDENTAFVLLAVARERQWYLLTPDVPTKLSLDELEQYTIDSGDFTELHGINFRG